MPMEVMRVGHVGVRVVQRLVPVWMAVLGHWHGVVDVVVVPVVVAVGVLVLQGVMLMRMRV